MKPEDHIWNMYTLDTNDTYRWQCSIRGANLLKLWTNIDKVEKLSWTGYRPPSWLCVIQCTFLRGKEDIDW